MPNQFVNSAAPNAMEPRTIDLYGLSKIGFDPVDVFIYVLISVALLLTAYLLWKRYKKRGWKESQEIKSDPLVGLLGELKNLTPARPFEGKSQGDFYYILSLKKEGMGSSSCPFEI